MEGRGERATGTSNTIYDLSSILFHALEGGASYDQYVQDAEEAGDHALADFFRQVRDEDAARADEAQVLLAERTPVAGLDSGTVPTEGIAGGMPPRTGTAADAAPGTEPIVEEGVLPRTEGSPSTIGGGTLEDRERRTDSGEDKGLVDRVKDALSGGEEPGRREEGRDEPPRR